MRIHLSYITIGLLLGLLLTSCKGSAPRRTSPAPALSTPLASATMFPAADSPSPPAQVTVTPSADLLVTPTIDTPPMEHNIPPQPIFGVELSQLTTKGGLDKMAEANITWIRRNGVLWSNVEPTQGARNWKALAALENELENASGKGITVILVVRSTPEWARKIPGNGPYCGPIHPDKLAAFGSFMHDLVARYSRPPYNVKYWELWNEPDVAPQYVPPTSGFGCWGDQADDYYGGGYYAEMLKVAYPQIKSADPQAQVLIGGLVLDCDPRPGKGCQAVKQDVKPPRFFEGILRNDGGSYFDGVSYHAYDYYLGALGQYQNSNWQSAWNTTGPVMISKGQFLQNVLSQYGITDKFLMNTETAILCDSCNSDVTFETTKAYYLAQTYAAAIAQGLYANIWYSALGWRNSGLLNRDLSPRPAYTALQFARTELGNPKFASTLSADDFGGVSGITGFKFDHNGRNTWIIWSLDGQPHSLGLTSAPSAAWNVFGEAVTKTTTITVTLEPLYLEWTP